MRARGTSQLQTTTGCLETRVPYLLVRHATPRSINMHFVAPLYTPVFHKRVRGIRVTRSPFPVRFSESRARLGFDELRGSGFVNLPPPVVVN